MKPIFMRVVFFLLFVLCTYSYGQEETIAVPKGSTVELQANPTTWPEYVWFHNAQIIQGEHSAHLKTNKEGWYAVLAINAGGCVSAPSEDFEIRFQPSPTKSIQDQVFCRYAHAQVADLETPGDNPVNWYTLAQGGTPLALTEPLTSRVYYVAQIIAGLELKKRVPVQVSMISCEDLLTIKKTVDKVQPIMETPVVFSIRVKNVSPMRVQDVLVEDQLPTGYALSGVQTNLGTYNFSTNTWHIPELLPREVAVLTLKTKVLKTGNYRNKAIIISSNPDDPDDDFAMAETFPVCVQIFNEFSPNGDGQNETFRITCLSKYPNNILRVYTRYGQLVFKKKNYGNTWGGTMGRGMWIVKKGERLPSGTYFYSLYLGHNYKPLVGWLYINRD